MAKVNRMEDFEEEKTQKPKDEWQYLETRLSQNRLGQRYDLEEDYIDLFQLDYDRNKNSQHKINSLNEAEIGLLRPGFDSKHIVRNSV